MGYIMNASKENLKKAEKESKEAWNNLKIEMDKLFSSSNENTNNGLGPPSTEEKELINKFLSKTKEIRRKYGIEMSSEVLLEEVVDSGEEK